MLMGSFIENSQPLVTLVVPTGLRIFLALFLVMFFTLTTGYKGGLISSLTFPATPKPMGIVLVICVRVRYLCR